VRRSPLPFGLWTIGDQCLLHHWLDHAVNQGMSRVHVYAADRPAAVRHVLEDSLLWPLTLEFHSLGATSEAPADATLVDWLPGAAAPPDAVKLALSAHETTGRLPVVQDGQPACPPAKSSVLAVPPPPANGWDLITRAASMEQVWLERMAAGPDQALLSIGFSCKIHPQAKLIAPYFIGDEVFIGPGCEIGPYAVIGHGSVLTGANRVAHSHLAPRSFLGPVTALENCLLDSGVLFNLKHCTRLDHIEPHLLGSLAKPASHVPLRDRLLALLLYLRLGVGRASSGSFVTFDGRRLPGDPAAGLSNRRAWLPLVWRGQLPLYGILPRSTEQFAALNPDWQNLIRHAPIGVFAYADSQGCHSPADPEEALHAVYQASLPPAALSPAIAGFIRRLQAADLSPPPSHA
ncbi:MAG: hypothetical protein WCP35_17695, partial [Verrucomicrobiota bacterium]